MKHHALTLIVFSLLSTPALASLPSVNIDFPKAGLKVAFLDERTQTELQNEVEVADNNGGLKLSADASGTGGVQIDVNLVDQTLIATDVDGTFTTKMSGADSDVRIEKGCYTNPHLEQVATSIPLEDSPATHLIHFSGGVTIRGTLSPNDGLRVSPFAASVLYGLIDYYGAAKSKLCVF